MWWAHGSVSMTSKDLPGVPVRKVAGSPFRVRARVIRVAFLF